MRFTAIMIDGIDYAGETIIVALGIITEGYKLALGLRQGATENAEVATSLLEDLRVLPNTSIDRSPRRAAA